MIGKRVDKIEGVAICPTQSAADKRGRLVKFSPFEKFLNPLTSIAISYNPVRGTIRGLHFQVAPFEEEKLVTCIQGSVFDVIIDLRPSSQTFGKWTSLHLDSESCSQVYLPKGIAHGFQTLSPNTILHYGLNSIYSQEHAFSISPFGDLEIDWPLSSKLVSERDRRGISIIEAIDKYTESIENYQ